MERQWSKRRGGGGELKDEQMGSRAEIEKDKGAEKPASRDVQHTGTNSLGSSFYPQH